MPSRTLRLALCFLLLAGAGSVSARTDSVLLSDLTWTELRDRIHDGSTTILVPIGGTEQSGPDMALGKHNVRAAYLAQRIAIELGHAIVAPTIAYVPEGNIDPPTGHMGFPGTISIPVDVFEKTLEAAARSFKHHGFTHIVFLGDHGGYQKSDRAVADRLNKEWAKTPARAHAIDAYYRATQDTYVQELKRRGFTDDEIGTHAGLADTSLTMAIAPDLVRADRLRAEPKLSRAQGVYGDPRKSSAELGKLGVEAVISQTVQSIRKAEGRP